MPARPKAGSDPTDVGLPIRPFLYTLDQICSLLCVDRPALHRVLWYVGRNVGQPDKVRLVARNIAAPDEKPEWRVAEPELIRWMKLKGFRIYERSWLQAEPRDIPRHDVP